MSQIHHPVHYGGSENPHEPIKVIEYYGCSFAIGNLLKYCLRAGKKDPNKTVEDYEKAAWYLNREIQNLKSRQQHCRIGRQYNPKEDKRTESYL